VADLDVAEWLFCTRILPEVSRTFGLGIRLLPRRLSESVTIAYLLCRIADTVEDDRSLAPGRRTPLLHRLAEAVRGGGGEEEIEAAFEHPTSADQLLAHRCGWIIRSFRRLSVPEQAAIAGPVCEMCLGMAAFIDRRATGGSELPEPLETLAELKEYCGYVAGTVGRLLTGLFCLHTRQVSNDLERRLSQHAEGFANGLQLTNVIKDIHADAARGISFIPRDVCARYGIEPKDLLDPRFERESSAVLGVLGREAQSGLDQAVEYLTEIPQRQYRIRLFCQLPILLGCLSLSRMRLGIPGGRIRFGKVSRTTVYLVLALSLATAWSNRLARASYRLLASAPLRDAGAQDPLRS